MSSPGSNPFQVRMLVAQGWTTCSCIMHMLDVQAFKFSASHAGPPSIPTPTQHSHGPKNSTNSQRETKGATADNPRPANATASEPGVPEKLGQEPLRLILVGHNPSAHAWQSGHYYSNPSNRLWPILIKTGIAPPGAKGPESDDCMPHEVGVGFSDVGSGTPGTDR